MSVEVEDYDSSSGVTRRHLLLGAGALSAASLLGLPRLARAAGLVGEAGPVDPATALLRAYVSTLVPGPGDDPTGAPGAVEAGAVEQMQAQVPYILAPLMADLTGAAFAAHRKPFAELTYAQREALLVEAFANSSRAPYHLIALAIGAGTFYGDFRNRVGGEWMGFPGESDGYLDTYTDRTGHGQPQLEAVPA